MKLIVFCLFAICCSSLANRTNNTVEQQRRKLEEVLRQLRGVRDSLEHGQMLHTPPKSIEDCCCLSALECFRANLQVQFNVTGGKGKLNRSLKHHLTVGALNFCNSGNVQSTCQDCASHPKENATEFFNRLESLIQRGITKLNMN